MLIRNVFAAATLGLALVGPATSFAETHSAKPCILREHQVVSVTPYNIEERDWRGHLQRRLGGAAIYTRAEPGLTAEWLQLQLNRHFSEMRGAAMPDCVFALDDIQVGVDSAGAGFAIRVVSNDKAKADEILRRARLLVDSK